MRTSSSSRGTTEPTRFRWFSEILRSLVHLFALSRIEADRGWYLESGYLEPPKSRAIRAQVNELCEELRAHARFLVDAFGIPDEVLGAPIAVASGRVT